MPTNKELHIPSKKGKGLNRYNYPSSLKDEEIRILIIHPGDRNNPIECDLQVTPLADRPVYETLSYVW